MDNNGIYKLWISVLILVQVFTCVDCFMNNIRPEMSQCVPVQIQQCKKLGYNLTRPVDLYSTAGRNVENGKKFIALVDVNPCSTFALFFLCAVYSPLCLKGHHEPIKPCRTVCYLVKERCSRALHTYGIEWPEELSCEHLPEYDNGVCIQPSSFLTKQQGRKFRRTKDLSSSKPVKCGQCKKHHRHVKFRHYRKADYVIEATMLSRETTAHGRTKLLVNVTKVVKKGKVNISLGKMKLWSPSKCICPRVEFDKKYIIMGMEYLRGNKHRLLFDQHVHLIPYENGVGKLLKWREKCRKKGCENRKNA